MLTPQFCIEKLEARCLLSNFTLDPSFGRDGAAELPYRGDNEDAASAIAVLPRGKAIVAGTTHDGLARQVFLARLNADGSLDRHFGDKGIAVTNLGFITDHWINGAVSDIAVLPDGKILVAGANNGFLAAYRFQRNGRLDHSFGFDGIASVRAGSINPHHNHPGAGSSASSMVLLPDGKILLAGRTRLRPQPGAVATDDILLVRLNSDGSLDKSFDDDGVVTTNLTGTNDANLFDIATDVAVDHHRRIVVTASSGHQNKPSSFALLRYSADGSLDRSFSEDGIITGSDPDGLNSLVILDDDSIVATGPAPDTTIALLRFTAEGTGDAIGEITASGGQDHPQKLIMQGDHKFVVVSTASEAQTNNIRGPIFSVSRFNGDGTRDSSFCCGSYGGDTSELPQFLAEGPAAIAMTAEGEFLVAGTGNRETPQFEDALVMRLKPNGLVDPTFGKTGQSVLRIRSLKSLYPLRLIGLLNGKILTYSTNRQSVLHVFNRDGSLDRSFGNNGSRKINEGLFTPLILTGSRIFVPTSEEFLAFNLDGSRDRSFTQGGDDPFKNPMDQLIQALPDGKLIVSTSDHSLRLERLNRNGSIDRSFAQRGASEVPFEAYVYNLRLLVQPDGKIISIVSVEPRSASIDDPYRSDIAIVRFNSNGQLDEPFADEGKLVIPHASYFDSFLDASGKLIVAARSAAVRIALYKVSPSGTISATTPIPFSHAFRGAIFDLVGNVLVFAKTGLLRFNLSGHLNARSGSDRIKLDSFSSVGFDSDNNLLIAEPLGWSGLILFHYRMT